MVSAPRRTPLYEDRPWHYVAVSCFFVNYSLTTQACSNFQGSQSSSSIPPSLYLYHKIRISPFANRKECEELLMPLR